MPWLGAGLSQEYWVNPHPTPSFASFSAKLLLKFPHKLFFCFDFSSSLHIFCQFIPWDILFKKILRRAVVNPLMY